MHKRYSQRGFTIVELLVVVVVISILAAISIVSYTGIQQRARDAQRRQDISAIATALELYHSVEGRYPAAHVTSAGTLGAGWSTTADESWQTLANNISTYMTTLPRDPISTPNVSVLNSGTTSFNYAYFTNRSGTYCGSGPNQMYILVYRLENGQQETRSSGDCSTSPLSYHPQSSFYRVSH